MKMFRMMINSGMTVVFDFELSDEEMEQIRAIDKGESGRYFNINYQQMGGLFTSLSE